MKFHPCAHALALVALLGTGAAAQAPQPEPAAAAAAEPAPAPWSAGGIEFSGLVDGYYSLNFNHPAGRANQLRNFDANANQFGLNMMKLTMEHKADPVGFRVDLGFGPAFDIVNANDPGGLKYIEQAYVSFAPKQANGVTFDFGKFVTSHGAEVIETHSNWNYSRGLLFAWAIPYYHFGLRATVPVAKTFTFMFHVVNGWNNTVDNNTGKSFGVTGLWNPSSHFSLASNYMVGPEKPDTNKGYRHLSSTVATVTVDPKVAFMGEFDYGADKFETGGGKASWKGVAGYIKLSNGSWFSFIPRIEWFKDSDGFSTGTAQSLKEATLTAEFKLAQGLLSRLEYRRDWSDEPFFNRGGTPASSKSQTTLLAGFVVYFGPK